MCMIKELLNLRDEKYADFQRKLIPNIPPESVIGVRTPLLRGLAVKLAEEGRQEEIYSHLPHKYFEENQIHAFLISGEKDFGRCIVLLEKFLPFVDNWATCDQMSPGVFKKNKDELIEHIDIWMSSDKAYTVRFGLGMLMTHFLGEDFRPEYLEKAAKVHSDEYYVNMMIAWFFATALAKQYGEAVKYIEEHRLDRWVHNKAIKKSVESLRIPEDRKEYLKTFRKRGRN